MTKEVALAMSSFFYTVVITNVLPELSSCVVFVSDRVLFESTYFKLSPATIEKNEHAVAAVATCRKNGSLLLCTIK